MDRSGIFAGEDPFAIASAWLTEAEAAEPNDPNAIALATVVLVVDPATAVVRSDAAEPLAPAQEDPLA